MNFKEIGTKNLRHLFSVLCSSSVLSADTNNLSLNNLIEKFTVQITKEMLEQKRLENANGYAFPFEFEIISRFSKKIDDPVAFEIKYEFVNPKGNTIAELPPNNFGIQKGIKSIRIRSKFSPLPVDDSGEYTIVVLIKEAGEEGFTEVDRIPLEINLESEE
ncbi:MAG: hypothetical protein P4L81_01425 [Candidatus Pacebacteria bacterium]|nr:hypothetical protein [Candidatus Paceibacterota bacterium]